MESELRKVIDSFLNEIITGMELRQYFIERTPKTPQVDLNNLTGELILSGRSIPENPARIYEPVIQWINQYIQRPHLTTNLRLNLEYFNTASVIWLGKIIKVLCNIQKKEYTLIIHLYLDIEEFDDMEGEDFKDTLSPFIDMVGNPVISLGIKIYGTGEKGEIIKESMVLI